MQIECTGKNLTLTEANEGYAMRKLEKLPRYFDRIQRIELIAEKAKVGYKCETIIDVEHHDAFVASCEDPDLYAAIDMVTDRAIRQLKDHKSRLRDHKHAAPTSGKDA